jgi:uncharacterized membrane protein
MTGTVDRTTVYLDDLARMLQQLDTVERADVLEGVREHVEAALGSLGREPTERDIDRVLAELGSPAEVAAAALSDRGSATAPVPLPAPQPPLLTGGWVPATAVGLIVLGLMFAFFLLPLLLTLVGLLLLCASPLWSGMEKTLGTALPVLGVGGVVTASLLIMRWDAGGPAGPTVVGLLLLAGLLGSIVYMVLLVARGTRRSRDWPSRAG